MQIKVLLAHIAMFLVSLFYAANFTIAKVIMANKAVNVQPFGFILLRVSAATILFWLVHRIFVRERVEAKDYKLIAACALFGVATNQLTFFKGLELTTPINGALIMLITPILVLLFAFLSGKERVNTQKMLGIALGLFGAFLLIYNGPQKAQDAASPMLGNLFIGINAASYAIYLIIVKPLTEKYNPITIMKWMFSLGFCYVLPFGFEQVQAIEWQAFEMKTWYALGFVLIFVTFFAYLLNAAALSVVNSSLLSTYVYLQPLLASIIAVSFYGTEELSIELFIAAVMIFAGVFLVAKKVKPSTAID